MATAQSDFDAARLLLVKVEEDLEYLDQALRDTPDDPRLIDAVRAKEVDLAEMVMLVEICRQRLAKEQ